jgi:DNA primase catalytic core
MHSATLKDFGDRSAQMPLGRQEEVQDLKAAVDLAALVQDSGVPLRAVGRNLIANCPFHTDHEASFVVNPQTHLFNCFGCQTGGDAFTFLQRKEGLTFPQALERLRQFAGRLPVASEKDAPGSGRRPPDGAPSADVLGGGFSRNDVLARVVDVYADALRTARDAQQYLVSRGLDSADMWRSFRIGVATGALLETLPESGGIRDALTTLGVLTPTGREHFAGCIVVPLTHPDQGIVGLYGRKISRDARVRHLYLPGPQRGVFNWQALQRSDSIVVAESVIDALSLWVAGCRDVTCLYGVQGMPKDLDELTGRFNTREVRFCLDADEAGREATARLSAILARRGIRCLTMRLPDGEDPNQVLVERGVDALQEALGQTFAPELEAAESPENPPRREETGDGFSIAFGQVQYQVTPRPPFTGRMRVTLRVFHLEHRYLDNLDLFSHRARAIAINQITSRLKLRKEFVERHLATLIEEAERWVAQLHDASKPPPEDTDARPAQMTAQDRDEALAFLKRPDLVDAILEDMEAFGYTGEEQAKLLGYLIGVSRKLERPLSGIIISQSGAGKSTLAELVEQLTPPENVVLYTRLTAQSLAYMPKDALKRKLVIIEEREGATAAEYHIRVLQSRQRLAQLTTEKDPATGKMRSRVYEVEGPIAYLETTTSTQINHENATRCFELHLDESEEQTRRIHQRQRESRIEGLAVAGPSFEAVRRRHHTAQRLLEPVRVFVPFAPLLSFPVRWLRTRRDHERFLSLIDTIAFLHQHQRESGVVERDGQPVRFIRASVADYRLAYQLAKDVIWSTLHELTHDGRELLETVRTMTGGDTRGVFTRRDIRNFSDWQDYRLRTALQELVEMEYVGLLTGGQGRTCQYRLVAASDDKPLSLHDLTTPEELEARMAAVTGHEAKA